MEKFLQEGNEETARNESFLFIVLVHVSDMMLCEIVKVMPNLSFGCCDPVSCFSLFFHYHTLGESNLDSILEMTETEFAHFLPEFSQCL